MANEIVQVDLSKELSASSNTTYCSIQGGDRETLARIYNAANNPTHKVGDFINKVIKVKDEKTAAKTALIDALREL